MKGVHIYYSGFNIHSTYLSAGCKSVSGGLLQSAFPEGQPQEHAAKTENIVPGEAIVYKRGGKPSDSIP